MTAPTTGPIATFWGRMPSAPTTAPVAVPTVRGPAVVSLPATQPKGAANAVLTAMRCHSAGISPSFWRALATASDAPRATAPTSAAPAAARTPRCAASDAPASPPIEAAKPMEELVAMRANLAVERNGDNERDCASGARALFPMPARGVETHDVPSGTAAEGPGAGLV